ncbi:hypothetical protein ADUPG1_002777, partial [Aduncisulcus paluster]
ARVLFQKLVNITSLDCKIDIRDKYALMKCRECDGTLGHLKRELSNGKRYWKLTKASLTHSLRCSKYALIHCTVK